MNKLKLTIALAFFLSLKFVEAQMWPVYMMGHPSTFKHFQLPLECDTFYWDSLPSLSVSPNKISSFEHQLLDSNNTKFYKSSLNNYGFSISTFWNQINDSEYSITGIWPSS